LKVLSIVGARPQFIKAAPVSRALRARGLAEVLVHTGQHYDRNMSALFFDELNIPEPHYNLEVGSGPHGWQTGQMLARIEEVLVAERPAWVLVYGDTNSTLAGALAAVKLHIPVAHVEAGLRSFNRAMPEEHNRVLTDHAADLLFCPTQTAVEHLTAEGVTHGVHLTGDVMYDAVLYNSALAQTRSTVLQRLAMTSGNYSLATVHRPQNTDDPETLAAILRAFSELRGTIVFPAHPRTRDALAGHRLQLPSNVRLIDAVGYLDMLVLEKNARLILTDSGGVQKEAYFFGVPCVTLREETEWVETVDAGWNMLVGADPTRILAAARTLAPASVRTNSMPQAQEPIFGDGQASEKVARILSYHSSGVTR
jgi:UDP-N-acetylglucosamine 2-epimerase